MFSTSMTNTSSWQSRCLSLEMVFRAWRSCIAFMGQKIILALSDVHHSGEQQVPPLRSASRILHLRLRPSASRFLPISQTIRWWVTSLELSRFCARSPIARTKSASSDSAPAVVTHICAPASSPGSTLLRPAHQHARMLRMSDALDVNRSRRMNAAW